MKHLLVIAVLTLVGVSLTSKSEVTPTDPKPNITLSRAIAPELNNTLSSIKLKSVSETVTLPEPVIVQRPVVPGNGYDPGNCTFWVKEQRPDIGNYWGNADQWGYSAAAEGYSVNNSPSVGSIGVATGYMHVVYIEAVNRDGTVTLSEMNYVSLGVVSTRVAPISEFVYIH